MDHPLSTQKRALLLALSLVLAVVFRSMISGEKPLHPQDTSSLQSPLQEETIGTRRQRVYQTLEHCRSIQSMLPNTTVFWITEGQTCGVVSWPKENESTLLKIETYIKQGHIVPMGDNQFIGPYSISVIETYRQLKEQRTYESDK